MRTTQRSIACGCVLLLTVCTIRAQQPAPVLILTAPVLRQVNQRTDKNQADIVVAGVVKAIADVIEVKADLAAGIEHGEAVGWTTLAKGQDIVDGKFSGRLSLKAGGWYIITVRARSGEDVVAETAIKKVGVGEVFVTAGQSNSANFGKPRQTAKDDRVVYLNGKRQFVQARDPIPNGIGSGGSAWPILGDLIAQSQQVPVCFRSATPTWTEVKNWMPGVRHKKWTLYSILLQRVNEFPQGGVRAVLWHQGESDSIAKTAAADYRSRLQVVIEALNKDAGYAVPWFVAQASFHPNSGAEDQAQVAKGQQLLWKNGVANRGPNTDALGKEYRSDGVHFNQRGLRAHGEGWFEALADAYKWKP